jgi:hypothetical protein
MKLEHRTLNIHEYQIEIKIRTAKIKNVKSKIKSKIKSLVNYMVCPKGAEGIF